MTISRRDHLRRWSQLHGGYDPARSRLVSGWLTVAYTLARPLAGLRVHPDVVTVAGGALAAAAVWFATLGGRWLLLAALAVALSGLGDGIDGTVAVISGRQSDWGGVLDSVVDRVADALLLLAFYYAGAPAWACLAAGVIAYVQEYARARAGASGVTEIAVVTIGERPTRVLVVALFLLAAGIGPAAAATWAAAGSYVLLAVAVVAAGQLLVALRRRLR